MNVTQLQKRKTNPDIPCNTQEILAPSFTYAQAQSESALLHGCKRRNRERRLPVAPRGRFS